MYPRQSDPCADAKLLQQLGMLADRMSVNIELPSQQSLKLLAPDKSKHPFSRPWGLSATSCGKNASDLVKYHHAPKFAPAGQSTQMIIGATPDTDYQILNLTEGLYQKYKLKRVFLFRLSAGKRERSAPSHRHQAASSSGAPPLPGGLASPLLRL